MDEATQSEITVLEACRANPGGLRSSKYFIDHILEHGPTRKISAIKLLRLVINESIQYGIEAAQADPSLRKRQVEREVRAAYDKGVNDAAKVVASMNNDVIQAIKELHNEHN